MSTDAIQSIRAPEVLGSGGTPILRAWVPLRNGTVSVTSVPSGTSAGQHEAMELRDGDPTHYAGKGILQPISHVNERIAPGLIELEPFPQAAIDRQLLELGGTPAKTNLDANAILAVSMATVRIAAHAQGLPLHAYFSESPPRASRSPC